MKIISNQENETFVTKLDENTTVVTSDKLCEKAIERAVYQYNSKNYISSYFNEENSLINFTIKDIDDLAYNAQSKIDNIIKINDIIRYFINKNDILGKVHEVIGTNINSDYELIFPKKIDDNEELFSDIKDLIEDFNNKIGLRQLIIESISMCFDEGNYILNLRKDSLNKIYTIDYFPLKVAEIADYKAGPDPCVLINITELTNRLRKVYKKTRKGTPLFYTNLDEEIKNNYPIEIYSAYKNKEKYAKLDIKNTGVMRINNLGRKYGLSPIFKTLKSIIYLEEIKKSDNNNVKAKGQKIIFQKMRKELITNIKDINSITNWYEAISVAHGDIIKALKTNPCVYTAAPWVESIEYVEPKLEQNDVAIKKQSRLDIMTALGINFLSSDKVGTSQISITELMKLINKIATQLSDILEKWYKGLLLDNGYDISLCPKIKILDSEKLSQDIVKDLVQFLFSTMGCSYETAYKFLGIDINEEFRRRKEENNLEYEQVFRPHPTSYTTSGTDVDNNSNIGRPNDDEDIDRQDYDEQRKKDDGVT